MKRKSCDGRRASATGKVYHPAKMLDSVTPLCRGQWAGDDGSLQRSLGGGGQGKEGIVGGTGDLVLSPAPLFAKLWATKHPVQNTH